ncbi:acetyl-CoA synthetase-like protein [Dendrothele bispora CBS 962.96]|uniref:Acetyl-CoA synthetase-like protein n=1 Tax=Dendrothele bispora (strain CBS 962.96) TaxID=1314807 RepID=A0A4S8LLV1_DENBC|nr:acetyl-CoA synthetase-like protein [Dendrothele bispora CBS 962.96]
MNEVHTQNRLAQVYTTYQGQNCPTFMVPPLDGSMLNGELIDWHIDHSKDHKFAVLVPDSPDEENIYSTFAELGEAVHALGNYIHSSIPSGPIDPATGKPKIIAIFASLDPLVYATTILAINRAGFQPFPLSPRNSQPALVHLINATKCKYIFTSTPSSSGGNNATAMELLSQAILDDLSFQGIPLQVLQPYHASDLYPRLVKRPVPPFVPNPNFNKSRLPPLSQLLSLALSDDPTRISTLKKYPWTIFHSSGSTKFPKPIYVSQGLGLEWLTWPWCGETDIGGKVLGTLATPSFHGVGVAMHVGAPLTSAAQSAFFLPSPPDKPQPPLTSERFLYGLKKSKAAYSVILPSFLKTWCDQYEMGEKEGVEMLKGLEICGYAAGPLSKSIGDKLVQAGVNLQNVYGMTEVGPLFAFFPKQNPGYDWQYGRFASHVKPRLVDVDGRSERWILQLLECDTHHLAMLNVIEGTGDSQIRAFDTNDIIEEHPVKKGYYRIVGRADDQIMMANGEKTNPVPLELIISSSPHLLGCFMFGRSRTQAGVAVEPKEPIDLSSPTAIASFRNTIFPWIERANALAPQYSRIFKELILITDPKKKGPLPRTPKGDVQRKKAEEMYGKEIEKIYREVEDLVGGEWAKGPERWDRDEDVRAFVGRVIGGTVGAQGGEDGNRMEVDPERDLFLQGCDSLQATYIRQAILTALIQYAATLGSILPSDYLAKIPNNFVYEHPTQRELEEFLLGLLHRDSNGANEGKDLKAAVKERKLKAMKDMVEKYTKDFPTMRTATGTTTEVNDVRKKVVLITGTTGTLGTYILYSLLLDSRIAKVYALNRASRLHQDQDQGCDLVERQRRAFIDKGLASSLIINSIQSGKLVLLEGNTSEPYLGLSKEVYNGELVETVTTIVANAWTLNFSMTLGGFESHVKGVRALIDLGLACSNKGAGPKGAQIVFSSSVSSISAWTNEKELIPEKELDPDYALGMGYGESKWVAERVLIGAAKVTGMHVSILRIGQLSGSRVNGAWNITDWVPQIVQSGPVLGMLPTFPKYVMVSWLPVDVAADAFIDVILQPTETNPDSSSTSYQYLNFVHTTLASWHTLFTSLSQALGGNIPLVPYNQWYSSLEQISMKPQAAEKVSAVKLVDFFAAGIIDLGPGVKREAMGMGMLETGMTEKVCRESIGKANGLNEKDTERWVEYWRECGMFRV